MKAIITGIIVFALWSTLSTYLYVCKIQGLCGESISLQATTPSLESDMLNDTLTKVDVNEQAVLPKDLVSYFEFDKSEFKVNELTEKYFNESKVYLNEFANAKLMITGNTDAIGTEEYNQALGLRRAESTKRYFEQLGIPAERILIESKGETKPVDTNSTSEGRANNRRTETTINK